MVSFWNIALRLHNFAGPVVMLAYPLYASVSAIESPFKEDDTQWLTYWVLYSFIQLIELGFERVIYWIPLWYTVKLIAVGWLVLPQFHGAAFVYENFVRKHISGANAPRTENLSPKQRKLIERMSPQARASVSNFIGEYGPDAFDSVVASITIEAKRKTKSPSSASRHRGAPLAAQPVRYPGSSPGAQSNRYTGSPPRYTGSPPRYTSSPRGVQPTEYTGSPGSRVHTGDGRSDSFREYCRQPVKLLKTGLHSLENRRNEIRSKMRTKVVT